MVNVRTGAIQKKNTSASIIELYTQDSEGYNLYLKNIIKLVYNNPYDTTLEYEKYPNNLFLQRQCTIYKVKIKTKCLNFKRTQRSLNE